MSSPFNWVSKLENWVSFWALTLFILHKFFQVPTIHQTQGYAWGTYLSIKRPGLFVIEFTKLRWALWELLVGEAIKNECLCKQWNYFLCCYIVLYKSVTNHLLKTLGHVPLILNIHSIFRKPRNEPTTFWSTNLQQSRKYPKEKRQYLQQMDWEN